MPRPIPFLEECRFYDTARDLNPGQRLCLAMVVRGLLDLLSLDKRERQHAARWMFLEDVERDPDYVLSFSNCCEFVGLNFERVKEVAEKIYSIGGLKDRSALNNKWLKLTRGALAN